MLSNLSRTKSAIAIFARAPVPGKAKRRLGAVLGARGAADFQAALISDTIRKVNALSHCVSPYLFISGQLEPLNAPGRFSIVRQRGRDLGERLKAASSLLLARHDRVVIIGTDSPTVSPRVLRQALGELGASDAVLGPCLDGGFYLIALGPSSRFARARLYYGVRWGTSFAYRDMLKNLRRAGLVCSVLEPVADVDRPKDLAMLRFELESNKLARRMAPSVWKFLRRFRFECGGRPKRGTRRLL